MRDSCVTFKAMHGVCPFTLHPEYSKGYTRGFNMVQYSAGEWNAADGGYNNGLDFGVFIQ